jgi:hypothetical protein
MQYVYLVKNRNTVRYTVNQVWCSQFRFSTRRPGLHDGWAMRRAVLICSAFAVFTGTAYAQNDLTKQYCIRANPTYNDCERDRIDGLLRVQRVRLSAGQPLLQSQPFWCDPSKARARECERAQQTYKTTLTDLIEQENRRATGR